MSEQSLTELEKLQAKLLLWIKNDKNYLGDYKDFYYSEGDYYFHISFTGLNKNTTVTKLNDLWDIKTKKPLSEKEKLKIKSICDKILKEEKRLREIQSQISTAILGDDFFDEKAETSYSPNAKYTHKMFDYCIERKEKNKIPFNESAANVPKVFKNYFNSKRIFNIDGFLRRLSDYYNKRPKKPK